MPYDQDETTTSPAHTIAIEICNLQNAAPDLQRLQVLDDFHTLFFRELAADRAVSYWTVVEFMAGVRVAGFVRAELFGVWQGFRAEAEFAWVILLFPR